MNNFDDIFVNQKTGETANNKDFVPFNKDEWAARKQQERADAYALIDQAAVDAAKDGGVFQAYLDVQSRFDRYSVGNALLITIQMPEATRLADFNSWKDNNVYVKKGAIIVLACIIFSVFASSPPVVDPNAAAASMVWSYIGELIFNMLVLVGSVKMADRIVSEMMFS